MSRRNSPGTRCSAVPGDQQQAETVAERMWSTGLRAIVAIVRGDICGDELAAATAGAFAARGGTIVHQIRYDPDEPHVEDIVREADTWVTGAGGTFTSAAIGVYLVSFDEEIPILAAGQASPALREARWFGSDGLAQNAALLRDPAAAAFADQTGLACPTIGLSAQARPVWERLLVRSWDRFGVEEEALSFASYDAFWVGSLAALATGPADDADALRRAVHRTADSYFGATGWTRPNAAGDRAAGDCDFWAVTQAGAPPAWERAIAP